MKYAFFNDVDNDRLYMAEDFAAYFAKFIGNGVYASPASSMQVSAASSGLAVKVSDGGCFINGYYANAENEPLITLPTAHGSYGRYDLIVARLDFTKRNIHIEKITGTAAESPVYPEIVRNDVQYDIALAAVFVAPNAVEINDADITDLRSDNAYCGFVTGVVEQIDTTELFKQYQTAWELLMAGAALDEPAIIAAFNALSTVKTVNGNSPDENGNVDIDTKNIDSIPVDLTGIYNTQVIGYDEESGKLVPMNVVARTQTVLPTTEAEPFWTITGFRNITTGTDITDFTTDTSYIFVNFPATKDNEYILNVKMNRAFLLSEYTNMLLGLFHNASSTSGANYKVFLSKTPDFSEIEAEFSKTSYNTQYDFDKKMSCDISALKGYYYIKFEITFMPYWDAASNGNKTTAAINSMSFSQS